MKNICKMLQMTSIAVGLRLDCGTDGMVWAARLVYDREHEDAPGSATGEDVVYVDADGNSFNHYDVCERGAEGRNGMDALAALDAQCAMWITAQEAKS